MFLAVVVMLSVQRTLDQRPEAFDCVGVDQAFDILDGVVDGEVGNPLSHTPVGGELVGYENAVAAVYVSLEELVQALGRNLRRGLGDNLAASLNGSDYRQLARAAPTGGG